MGSIPLDVLERIRIARELVSQTGRVGRRDVCPGDYVFQIEKVFAEIRSDGRYVVFELFVEEATKTCETQPNSVGSRCVVEINFDGSKKEVAPKLVKEFVLGLFGRREHDASHDDLMATWKDLSGAANPANGMLIGCSAYRKQAKNSGWYTRFDWRCVGFPNADGANSREEVVSRINRRLTRVVEPAHQLKAIETSYKGYRFRSRLEARWAVFFDSLYLKWQYEAEGFDLGDGIYYLPDFWFPDLKIFVEIKGQTPTDSDLEKIRRLGECKPIVLIVGVPGEETITYYSGVHQNGYQGFKWCVCEKCLCIGLGPRDIGDETNSEMWIGGDCELCRFDPRQFHERIMGAQIAAKAERFGT